MHDKNEPMTDLAQRPHPAPTKTLQRPDGECSPIAEVNHNSYGCSTRDTCVVQVEDNHNKNQTTNAHTHPHRIIDIPCISTRYYIYTERYRKFHDGDDNKIIKIRIADRLCERIALASRALLQARTIPQISIPPSNLVLNQATLALLYDHQIIAHFPEII